MKVSDQILHAIEDAESGRFDSAMLHACIAVDATSKRMFPAVSNVRKRYVECLRAYYWILEPIIGSGINLVETKFSNVKLKATDTPDLAEIVYEVFRCSHAHGDDVPSAFSITPVKNGFSSWELTGGQLHVPGSIVWALIGVTLFSKVNREEKSTGDHYLSLGGNRFVVRDWWGCEEHVRHIAERYNQIRVKLEGLEGSWAE